MKFTFEELEAANKEETHGPEMTKLLDRLFNNPDKKLRNFNVFWGPNSHLLSIEELAKHLNDVQDQVDDGRAVKHDSFAFENGL